LKKSGKELKKLKINSIKLNNIGSYEGKSNFNFSPDDIRNITIIGGKNGAGKTTLFTAMRIAIYGYSAFGYQSLSSHYIRDIKKLINNKAKRGNNINASIELSISINNGITFDEYTLSRNWSTKINNSLLEKFEVSKNHVGLNKDEIQDFEKYILDIIPPSLFNLYFFDGEKITEFFFENGSARKIRDAIFTLCGYDNFEIIKRNFKRLATIKGIEKISAEYISLFDDMHKIEDELENTIKDLEELQFELKNIDEEIRIGDNKYSKNGGVTQKEWEIKFDKLKNEEKNREILNSKLKKYANDIIPFLMIKKQLEKIKEQVKLEDDIIEKENFIKLLTNESTSTLFVDEFKHSQNDVDFEILSKVINNVASVVESKIEHEKIILKLSFDEKIDVLNVINNMINFDSNKISKDIKLRKRSIKRSKVIRSDINNCNIDNIHKYVETKNNLLNRKDIIANDILLVEKTKLNLEKDFEVILAKFEIVKKKYEKELKNNSIKSVSGKGLLVIEILQEILIKKELRNVENSFMKEFSLLSHKNNFIDEIHFDSKYNIKIYRNEKINKKEINKLVLKSSKEILNELGKKALDIISLLSIEDIEESVIIPIEIDKDTFSNGEKQIYIMALYKALMELSRRKVPFVIDTPFARIDKEHRLNITEHFFKKLNGQVFILSTDEEITSEHLKVLKPNINSKFILDNNDNENKTNVLENNYFEGGKDAI
jgi:DNA sulfur modification protein DndD